MTTEEVARYLRVDKYTIYRLVSQNKLPALKVGNQWRFKRSILERWIKTNMNVPSMH